MEPFKVVCVLPDDCEWHYVSPRSTALGPKKGDICTVTRVYPDRNSVYYVLAEWPLKDNEGYNSAAFVRLAETEFKQITYTKIIEENPVGVQ